MRKILTIIAALFISITLISPCLRPVRASQVTLALDPAEYGGWMDAKSLSMDLNSTHTTLVLTFYGSIPNLFDTYWQSTFYLDVDQSLSTGSNWYTGWGMGVDYYISTTCHGDGYSTYCNIYKWNASRSGFDWVSPPPDFKVLFSVG
jgi:hypothetical protein